MSTNEYIEQTEWFKNIDLDDGDRQPMSILQQRFEHEMFRALTIARDNNKHPVIRCTEGIFKDYMRSTCGKVIGSCWSVYLFRGIPVALRGDNESPGVVEVVDHEGKWSTVFKIERKE